MTLGEFPFGIIEVASLLNLRIRRQQPNSVYTDCPFCGDRRGKMNINILKNVFRCNYCDESGGMVALYAKAHGINNSVAYREICDAMPGCPTEPVVSQIGHTGNLPLGNEVKGEQQSLFENSNLADIEEIHKTMTQLLGVLFLSDTHRSNLRNRGLTDEQINWLGYKSTPPFYYCRPITAQLMRQGCRVHGVPGFYIGDDGNWTVKFSAKTAGMLIPVKGIDGLIRGAQIRLDVPIKDKNDDTDKDGTKYLWLSSSNKHMGVTSGSPVHFVGDPFARAVYVTEGSLKADVAHCLMNRSFAAIAGANNLSQLDPVFSMLAHYGTKLIVEAHDMDKFCNKAVESGALKIHAMARKYGIEPRQLTWNPAYKGIDDWQLSLRNKPKEESFNE